MLAHCKQPLFSSPAFSKKVGAHPFAFGGKTSFGRSRRCTTSSSSSASASDQETSSSSAQNKKTVLVVGATGRTGMRVVRLLSQNSNLDVVCAGRSVDAMRNAVDNDEGVASQNVAPADANRISYVAVDVVGDSHAHIAEQIKARNVDVVISCIGAPESKPLDISAPSAIDGDGNVKLVEAAVSAGNVSKFVMVSSLGTGRFGMPASALNLFWGCLTHKRRAEVALEQSDLDFTIVRPGGMERPTDDHDDDHAIRVRPADSTFGGTVSRLQVARLVSDIVALPAESERVGKRKVLEVIAEANAPRVPAEALLEPIPSVPRTAGAGNTAEEMDAKYAYKSSDDNALLPFIDAMAPWSGAGPELANGRAAMVGALALLFSEFANRTTAVLPNALAHPLLPLAVALSVSAATMPPLMKGATPGYPGIEAGAAAERLNGRLAMAAMAVAVWVELVGVGIGAHDGGVVAWAETFLHSTGS